MYRAVFLNSRNSHMGLYVGTSFPRLDAPLPKKPTVPRASLRTQVQEGPDNSCVTPHPLLRHTDVARPCSSIAIADGLSLWEQDLSHLSSHPYLDSAYGAFQFSWSNLTWAVQHLWRKNVRYVWFQNTWIFFIIPRVFIWTILCGDRWSHFLNSNHKLNLVAESHLDNWCHQLEDRVPDIKNTPRAACYGCRM